MTIVDLLHHHEKGIADGDALLKKHAATSGFYQYLARENKVHVIKYMDSDLETVKENVHYHFFKGGEGFRKHYQLINSLRPNIIVVHGFQHPLETIRLKIRTKARIILQYHGGPMPSMLYQILHGLADRFIDGYFFTGKEQAVPFIKRGMIRSYDKVHEVMEGSTSFKRINKLAARQQLQIGNEKMFLWIGHLNSNKDPLTVLDGFAGILLNHTKVKLYMVYEDDALLDKVKNKISSSESLQKSVVLVGKTDHANIERYCSSADFFVLGSHYEGSGYALCEALACGCIPIVTDIPSFRMMTDNGKLGALWEPGNSQSFKEAVHTAMNKDMEEGSAACTAFFKEKLSHEAIAATAMGHFKEIVA